MRSLLLASGVLSLALCAVTASAEPSRPLYQAAHDRYISPPTSQHTTLTHAFMGSRSGGPGNPNEVTPPAPRNDGSLGTSAPAGWGGPNPAYHKK